MTSIEEVKASVEADHTETEFDFDQWLLDGGHKSASALFDVFTDRESAYEIIQLQFQIAALDDEYAEALKGTHDIEGPDTADLDARKADFEAQIDVLRDKLFDTRVTLHTRGVAPALKNAITKKARTKMPKGKDRTDEAMQEVSDWQQAEMLRKFIVKMEIHEHGITRGELTNEQMQKWLNSLDDSQVERLDQHFQLIMFGGELAASKAAEAGFPGGSLDVAEEL